MMNYERIDEIKMANTKEGFVMVDNISKEMNCGEVKVCTVYRKT